MDTTESGGQMAKVMPMVRGLDFVLRMLKSHYNILIKSSNNKICAFESAFCVEESQIIYGNISHSRR
jgi:hypothetical protein